MPFRPEHSLLRVEVPALHTIDTSSVESLMGMWSLFSKTSHAMEDGKRLENLSWRLWNRETFCCAPESQARSSHKPRCSHLATKAPNAATKDIPVPKLSSSLDSTSSDDLDDCHTSADPATTIPRARPELRRNDSTCSTSRGREKHITPIDLQNIVMSIQETKNIEPIEIAMPTPPAEAVKAVEPPTAALSTLSLDAEKANESAIEEDDEEEEATTPHPTSSSQATLESSASTLESNDHNITISKRSPADSFSSEDTSQTEMSTHSIVRGFIAGGAPSSYRSQTNLAAQPTPILKTSPKYAHAMPKKKGPMFTIGTSSGEEESSLESHMNPGSMISHGLHRPTGSGGSSSKKATFKEEVTVQRALNNHSPVFESDDEDDEGVSESAIEDDDEDDSSEWEDSDEGSGPSSGNEKDMFQRVDSRPNLTSRRSLLTTLMHEPDRAKALSNAASRSSPALRRSRTSTPNGPSASASPRRAQSPLGPGEGTAPPPGMLTSGLAAAPDAAQSQEIQRSKPIIMTTSNTHDQLALSPRTTRRNMLSTELTESLRKNLLWERQHRSTGNLAALKRRHTAHDMKNLTQHPEPAPVFSQQAKGAFNNEYFHAGLQEYHAKGW